MYIKVLMAILLSLMSSVVLAQGFNENYEILQGDFDGDNDVDLYIRQKPQIVLIHGDVITPITILPDVKDFVLLQGVDNALDMEADLDKLDLSSASSSSVDFELGDFNADGVLDLLITGVGRILLGVFDQIVFSNKLPHVPPLHLTPVDETLQSFFENIAEWNDSPEYFEENATQYEREIWRNTFVFNKPFWCDNPPFSENPEVTHPAPSSPYVYDGTLAEAERSLNVFAASCVNGRVYNRNFEIAHKDTEVVTDYSVFNQDALKLVRILVGGSDTDKRVDIESGSIEALVVEDKLEELLGVDINGEEIGKESEFGENLTFDRVGVHEFNVLMTDIDNNHTYLFDLNGTLITTSNQKHEKYLGKKIFVSAAMGLIARGLSRFIPRVFSKTPPSKGHLRILTGKYSESEVYSAWHVAATTGKRVILRPPGSNRHPDGDTSDLVVGGVNYDVVTLSTSSANRAFTRISEKNDQARGIVVDVRDSILTRDNFSNIMDRLRGKFGSRLNIQDVIIIDN